VTRVLKRDGSLVEFNKHKIIEAVTKAANETQQGGSPQLISLLATSIEREFEGRDYVSIEEIQDAVEYKLMSGSRKDIAKRYIIYREEKARLRKEGWQMTDLQNDILRTKYLYEGENFEDFLQRVGKGDRNIQKMIRDKKFLPAGRILMGRGLNEKGQRVTYSNCFVNEAPEDNIESIFDAAKHMARTYSFGGGVGIDLGKLRPKNSPTHNAAKKSSGATTFMHLYSTTTGVIGQSGRRGALMLSMPISHPDIEDFINIKTDLSQVTKANISLRISDDFMRAVSNDELWVTSFTTEHGDTTKKAFPARQLMHLIATNNWRMGEPGMLFWDRVTSYHINSEDPTFEYAGTNPCGEKPLPAGGSCLLGSINLAMYVRDGVFAFDKFDRDVRFATRYLDEVLEEGIPYLPLQQQKDSVSKYRQIGLGIMGLANAFIMLGITYGSKESLELSHKIGSTMINAALQESARLAKELGTYPAYNPEYVLKSPFLNVVATKETMALIKSNGLRNAELLSIAPTGSISTMIGTSGGIEPLFQISYTRRSESLGEDGDISYKVFEPIAKDYMEKNNITREEDLPEFFVTSSNLNYRDRIKLQSVWQMYVDAAISSTINLPEHCTIEEVEEIYMYAWQMGLKGITVFRDNCERLGILTTEATKEVKDEPVDPHDKHICPECGGNIKVANGCEECLDCGYSPCAI